MLRQSLFVCFLLALGACIDAQQPEKCGLAVAEGNCSESIQRWFYNNRTGICQSFIYRGCNGNANNFNSTMYCYAACNATSPAGASMYSAEEMARMLKAQQGGAAQPDGSAAGGSAGVTSPTNFGGQRRNQPEINPTGVPTLIQNRTAAGSPAASRPRQPVSVQSASAAAAAAGGRSPRNRRSITDEQHRQRKMNGKKVDSTSTEVDGQSNAVRKGHKTRSVLGELLEQMKSTADKLEKAIETARTGSRKGGKRHGGGVAKDATPAAKEEDSTTTTGGHAETRHKKSEDKKEKKHHGDKMLEITLTADGRPHEKKQKSSEKKTAVVASSNPESISSSSSSSSSGSETQQQAKKEENSAENDVEIVGDTIRSIIFDPSYVFSYQNITKDDMVSLQEIAAQSEVGTIKVVERREGEEDDDDDEDEIVDDDQETSSTIVPDATTAAAAAERNGEEVKQKSEAAKPVETPTAQKPTQELAAATV